MEDEADQAGDTPADRRTRRWERKFRAERADLGAEQTKVLAGYAHRLRGRVDLSSSLRPGDRVQHLFFFDCSRAERATRYVALLHLVLDDGQPDAPPWSLTPDQLPVLDLTPTVARLRAHTLLTAAPPASPAPTRRGSCLLVA